MNRREFVITAASPLLLNMRKTPISFPTAEISNGLIQAKLYLPDASQGFYRSTRFDWSGVIGSLEYAGHQYYGPWYNKSEPPVWDYEYRGADVVTGAQSTITGPAEEFPTPQGYTDAGPGGLFLKVGVGVLRKMDDAAYSPFANYELVDPGIWTSRAHADAVDFTQEIQHESLGYGYRYHKTIRLTPEKPELIITHRLTNIGRLPINTHQYNHNFLVLNSATTGPDFEITLPFEIETTRPPDPAFASIEGNKILYAKMLEDRDVVAIPIQGYRNQASDYNFQIENKKIGAGMRVVADQPPARMMLWSMRNTISMEPFIDVSTEPGDTVSWTLTYNYFEVG